MVSIRLFYNWTHSLSFQIETIPNYLHDMLLSKASFSPVNTTKMAMTIELATRCMLSESKIKKIEED